MQQLLLLFGPAFASEGRFWKSAAFSLLLGCISGLLALFFFNGFTAAFDFWTGRSGYKDNLEQGEKLNFGEGDWSWLFVTTVGGVLVGLMRAIPSFPSQLDGLFREVRDLSVQPSHAPLIFATSCLSLALGASVGPEAALGNIGGALGTLLGELRDQSDRRKAISAYCGMAGAMGALFPSPVLAVMLMHELTVTSRPGDSRFNALVGSPSMSFADAAVAHATPSSSQHDFMEQVSLGGIAAVAGYASFYGLAEYTYFQPQFRHRHIDTESEWEKVLLCCWVVRAASSAD